MGVIHRFVTPLVKVWANGKNKPPLSFFEEHDYKAWLTDNPTFNGSMKYYKGLGTSQEHEFREYLENINDHLIQLNIEQPEDSEVINLVFSKGAGSADKRKKWLALTEDGDDLDIDIDNEEE
jgi:DNA topoisomerase-2